MFVVPVAGCATHVDHLADVREAFYAGDLEAARAKIDAGIEEDGHDVDSLKLERAMVQLTAGQPREAERTLREVRDRFDYLEEENAAEWALSMLRDDNTLAYAGEDYEKVLVRAMLAVSNLLGDGRDAIPYALQINEKQHQIIQAGAEGNGENPKLAYKQVALGPYLHGVIHEESHRSYDVAARSYAQVAAWCPQFAEAHRDVERARFGVHSQRGKGALYVFAFVGRGPYKVEAVEVPTTVSLLLAEVMLRATGGPELPPSIAPVKVPKVVVPRNQVDNLRVSVDGRLAGTTDTITDVGRLAVEQYNAIYPRIVARAVARRVTKKAGVYATKEMFLSEDDALGKLLFDLAGVFWEAIESADTRCWGLLPEKIQVLRLELPAGTHHLTLQPALGHISTGAPLPLEVPIRDGSNTYVLVNFPASRLVGQPLVKAP